jgi:hypothetical protein
VSRIRLRQQAASSVNDEVRCKRSYTARLRRLWSLGRKQTQVTKNYVQPNTYEDVKYKKKQLRPRPSPRDRIM